MGDVVEVGGDTADTGSFAESHVHVLFGNDFSEVDGQATGRINSTLLHREATELRAIAVKHRGDLTGDCINHSQHLEVIRIYLSIVQEVRSERVLVALQTCVESGGKFLTEVAGVVSRDLEDGVLCRLCGSVDLDTVANRHSTDFIGTQGNLGMICDPADFVASHRDGVTRGVNCRDWVTVGVQQVRTIGLFDVDRYLGG